MHIPEAAHFLIGSPAPRTATANTFCHVGDRPCAVEAPWGPWEHARFNVEDLAVGMIRFDGGTMLALETSFAAHIDRDVWNIQIMGERGGATLDPAQIFTDVNGYMMTSTPVHLPEMHPFEYKMRQFADVARAAATT